MTNAELNQLITEYRAKSLEFDKVADDYHKLRKIIMREMDNRKIVAETQERLMIMAKELGVAFLEE